MIPGISDVGSHAVLELKKKRIKQVIVVFDDGSFKGYNRNAFFSRIKQNGGLM